MGIGSQIELDAVGRCLLPAEYTQVHWYTVQSCSRHEKRVTEQLQRKSIEAYLPIYEKLSRWKDRKKLLTLPLFPGYLFVRIALRDRLQILELPGVVRLVGFNGRPVALPDGEFEGLRSALALRLRVEPHPYLVVGRRVRIRGGAFEGFEGILLRKKGKYRVVLSVDLIMRSFVVDVDASDVDMVQ
jgi:transcription termination/antitermination protein NusG